MSTNFHVISDIDECVYSNHYCAEICINLEGSYKCACRDGFKLHWDRKYCTGIGTALTRIFHFQGEVCHLVQFIPYTFY